MKKTILTIIFAIAAVLSAAAQSFSVSGVVLDAKNQPVIGAVVMLEGSASAACVTDVDGKFDLNIPSKQGRLTASCLGYKSVTVDVAGKAKIDFTLEEDSEQLEEVVVVGYGSMRRSDLTGAVASVKVDEEDAGKSSSLDQLIAGKVSGVQVLSNNAAPDAGVSIRIRGLSSFNGSTEPLYVVDGIIINGASTSGEVVGDDGTNEQSNGLIGINPQDIASIEILKDASATAIYGSQGANGVVLITTKSATKEKPTVNVNVSAGVSLVNKHLPVLDFDEYVDYIEAIGCTTALGRIYENSSLREGLKVTPVDWQEFTLHPAVSQNYYMSVSGKPKTMSYFLSLGYNRTEGVVQNTGLDQFTMHTSLEKSINKKFKVGAKANFAYSVSEYSQGSSATRITAAYSMMRSMISMRPFSTYDVYDEEDLSQNDEDAIGPDKWLKYFSKNKWETRFTPSIFAQWTILPWLTFKSTAGADYRSANLEMYKSGNISRTYGTTASKNTSDRLNFNWDNLFLVNKKFDGGHNLSGTLGVTMTINEYDSYFTQGKHIPDSEVGMWALNNTDPAYSSYSYTETRYQILSFLARAVYSYKDRYSLTATFRTDGSSKFYGSNKWASFPSFAGAWRINEEPWFNASWVSMLKLRLGWGMVGNQSVSPYSTVVTYSPGTVDDHSIGNLSGTQITFYQDGIANKDLRWETTEQWNVGLDMSFFKGRLLVNFDAYDKYTKDLLQTKQIARTSGFSTMWVNQGTIRNKGIELSFEAVPVKTRDFEWTLGGNISFNRNSIVEIGADMQSTKLNLDAHQYESYEDYTANCPSYNYFWGNSLRSSSSNLAILNIFIDGQPLGLFYGLKTAGIVQEGEDWPGIGNGVKAEPGDVKFLDLNGNGYIDDDDRTIIGDPNPDFTFGFQTAFNIKNFTISAQFNGSYGNEIYNQNLTQEYDTYNSSSTINPKNVFQTAYRDAWSKTNPSGTMPVLGYNKDNEYVSDRFVEDGSYLRMSNLSVGYKIPIKDKKSFVRRVNLSASCSNVFVLSNYSYWDPAVNSFGTDIKRMGVDVGSYPVARTFTFSAKFTF